VTKVIRFFADEGIFQMNSKSCALIFANCVCICFCAFDYLEVILRRAGIGGLHRKCRYEEKAEALSEVFAFVESDWCVCVCVCVCVFVLVKFVVGLSLCPTFSSEL
jgi:hypothetical protein